MRLSLHRRPRFLPTSLIPRGAREPERPKIRTVRDHLHDSLPPRAAPRSWRVVVIAVALMAATVAVAAGRLWRSPSRVEQASALAVTAEQGTRALVDESLHRHLRSLQ
ncbi:MAG: hypothetical protein HYS27_11295 [Deltaproteobacteria bacterium]|nr:hypothetical protein [Deltaproteobacteria bacterium]